MTTKSQLEEWRRLAERATEPPWCNEPGCVEVSLGTLENPGPSIAEADHNNAAFISASREAVPKLIDEVERLTKLLEERTSE